MTDTEIGGMATAAVQDIDDTKNDQDDIISGNTSNFNTAQILAQASLWNQRFCLFIVYVFIPVILIGTFWGASAAHHVISELPPGTVAANDTCLDQYQWSPLSNRWKVWLCLIPILIVFWGVLGLNLSSAQVSPFAMCVTAAIGLLYFGDEGELAGEDLVTVCGAVLLIVIDRVIWVVFEYVYSVGTAFFFSSSITIMGCNVFHEG